MLKMKYIFLYLPNKSKNKKLFQPIIFYNKIILQVNPLYLMFMAFLTGIIKFCHYKKCAFYHYFGIFVYFF